jgi:hypothetical protein
MRSTPLYECKLPENQTNAFKMKNNTNPKKSYTIKWEIDTAKAAIFISGFKQGIKKVLLYS